VENDSSDLLDSTSIDPASDILQIIRGKSLSLIAMSCQNLTLLMSIVCFYSCFFDQLSGHSVHVKLTIPIIVILFAQAIRLVTQRCPEYVQLTSLLLMGVSIVTAMEREILKSPHAFHVPER
jgi:hypothetical protein